jgi:Domain of unknown function (DUF3336)
MAMSKSYPEWYNYAAELDQSQKRDRWLKDTDDGTSKRYNWVFIRELMKDMQRARTTEDPIFALAVLQQCTRKVSLLREIQSVIYETNCDLKVPIVNVINCFLV